MVKRLPGNPSRPLASWEYTDSKGRIRSSKKGLTFENRLALEDRVRKQRGLSIPKKISAMPVPLLQTEMYRELRYLRSVQAKLELDEHNVERIPPRSIEESVDRIARILQELKKRKIPVKPFIDLTVMHPSLQVVFGIHHYFQNNIHQLELKAELMEKHGHKLRRKPREKPSLPEK